MELFELQLASGLGGVLNNFSDQGMSKGDISQLAFEKLIDSRNMSCRKLLRSDSYTKIIRQYNIGHDQMD